MNAPRAVSIAAKPPRSAHRPLHASRATGKSSRSTRASTASLGG
ncbi:MAG TPA: hypothetical protein VGM56_28590 [Byssovorax sp.]